MKKSMLKMLVFALFLSGCSKDDNPVRQECDLLNFKYYNGNKDFLGEVSNDYLLIGIDTMFSDDQIRNFISTTSELDAGYSSAIYKTPSYKFKNITVKLKSSRSCEEITRVISSLEQNSIVSYANYVMRSNDCSNLIGGQMGSLCMNIYGSAFYVKVRNENDLSDLNRMIRETNTELVSPNAFMSQWFELRAVKTSKGDALEMANFFYESGLFEHSEPAIGKYAVK